METTSKPTVRTGIGSGSARKSWLTLNDESEPVDDDFLADRLDIFAFCEGREKLDSPVLDLNMNIQPSSSM